MDVPEGHLFTQRNEIIGCFGDCQYQAHQPQATGGQAHKWGWCIPLPHWTADPQRPPIQHGPGCVARTLTLFDSSPKKSFPN